MATTVDNTPATVVPAPVDDAPDFDGVYSRLQNVSTVVKELLQRVKQLERQYVKSMKSRKVKKSKKTGVSQTPSGFAKPTSLSDDLCTFLDLSKGTELPRTEVTRLMNKYIKDNNLQNPEDKRTILPDAKLKALLDVKDTDKVTYFNLQTFLKPHFKKAT